MVGSAADKSAIVMETQAGYTAYFRDDDPREAKATVNGVHTGFPLKEAVWRTNHGYDPRIMKDYLWSQAMGTNTEKRYLIIHDAIVRYEQEKELVGFEQIVNITSIAGKKGANYFYCDKRDMGTNILSVAFSPSELVMYAAWEAFSGRKQGEYTIRYFIEVYSLDTWNLNRILP
jgi:NAD(P)-dependent dehydrogenase (short-subunit alcohol dehydrogenase family)